MHRQFGTVPSGKGWSRTSPELLAYHESRLLHHVNFPYKVFPVPLKNNDPLLQNVSAEMIHTFEMIGNDKKFSTPVVVIHGFASALATFANLYQALGESCSCIFAIDLLGFGRSSKPIFPFDDYSAERLFIDSIEAWRIRMKLPSIIICAHSFGAYVATNYAHAYPGAVKGLILFEPWGFPYRISSPWHCWSKMFESIVNPLLFLKLTGPVALSLMRVFTMKLFRQTFASIGDEDEMLLYLYHSNVQCTGDSGFMNLKTLFHRWHAKRPLSLSGLICHVTLIYGGDSWIFAQLERQEKEAFVEVIPDAGHQIYADQLELLVGAVERALGRLKA